MKQFSVNRYTEKHMRGVFKPKNPLKYKGDVKEIIYRSSWELKFMLEVDKDPSIVSWGSETVIIPYVSPKDNKYHRYFVDFVITRINKEGKKETTLIEIKPLKHTKEPPKPKKRVTRTYITESINFAVNKAKWRAANEYCKDRGWKFEIYTEDHLGLAKEIWKK